MYDIVFYWMLAGLATGLVVILAFAYPDLRKDYEAWKRAISGN
jgi:hypothetical protein